VSDTYKTIAVESQGLFKERGSRFIAFAYPVDSPSRIQEILDELKQKYHDARHQCYAWRLGIGAGETYRSNDDGEPSGTAGKPIYGQLLSRELTNLLVVVIRYFGGTKLGVPGLINAYREATADALNSAEIVEKTENAVLTVEFPYIEMNQVMKVIKDFGPRILAQDFDNRCRMILEIRKGDLERLRRQLDNVSGALTQHDTEK